MELDKRILPGKYILTCFDAKEAEKFVGQMGYAADDISMFSDLDYIDPGKLEYVIPENGNGVCYPYSVVTEHNRDEFAFFLPAAWVQSTEEQKQFAWDSLKLAGKLHSILHSQRYINWDSVSDDDFKIIAEIMAKHSREEKRFLRDVFERVLTYDEGRW